MSQGHEREHLLHMRAFGLLSSEKFTASGEVVKKRADLHFCPNCRAGFLNGNHFAAVDDDLRASFGFSFAASQSKSAHACNAGYRFTAKTHCADRGEIFCAGNFTGGMAFEAHEGIITAHAVTIIRDPDETAPAGLHFHGHSVCSSIQCIFH